MARTKSAATPSQRHDPLGVQLRQDAVATGPLSEPGRRTKRRKVAAEGEGGGLDLSERILKLAREQQDEMKAEERGVQPERATPALRSLDALDVEELSEEEEELEDDDEEVYEEMEIDEGDQAILDALMPSSMSEQPRILADIIMEKIEQHEAGQVSRPRGDLRPISGIPASANPKIVEVYTKVGQLLSRYKSGPLPKAFKIMPTLTVWPSLLALTEPQRWTPHACLAATRIFISTLDAKQSQRFLQEVLYDRIREEIGETKKLSVQSYQALKRALYKPAAFFKGILFPLCESGTCTLREALVIGSVIAKVSVPVLHSGAALLRLAEMEYSGPTSLFIRVLLDKKYALPYKVVNALVYHFIRFKRDPRELPVLWHQSFLTFAQRYKADMTPEQKDALLEVMRVKSHAKITPEIRRELVSSRARGEADPETAMQEDVWV